MFESKLRIGSLFGIPVFLHWTILLAVAGMLFQLGIAGLAVATALFTSVLAHEYAHALTARKYGVQTTSITLHYFGGAASMELNSVTPKQEALISLAGPAMSLAIAAAAFGGDVLWAQVANGHPFIAGLTIMTLVGAVNVVIAAFNLLPIFPLDGGRVLRAALQTKLGRFRATRASLTVSIVLSSALLALGIAKVHSFITISILLLVVSLILRRSYGKDAAEDHVL